MVGGKIPYLSLTETYEEGDGVACSHRSGRRSRFDHWASGATSPDDQQFHRGQGRRAGQDTSTRSSRCDRCQRGMDVHEAVPVSSRDSVLSKCQ